MIFFNLQTMCHEAANHVNERPIGNHSRRGDAIRRWDFCSNDFAVRDGPLEKCWGGGGRGWVGEKSKKKN